ncbi:MAG: nuclear transport factor 2 family protein [Acidimicrobiales bacterium]
MQPSEVRAVIRDLVEDWAIWRDAMDWERFRQVWHQPGRMNATWFRGSADDFVAASREGAARGVRILHLCGGTTVDIADAHALAQTKMTISQRAVVEHVECDVVCTGRFYDFFAVREGRWGLVERQPIYEKDRIDPVDPSARLDLDRQHLGSFPSGYRHLAYLQTRLGYRVEPDLPGLDGPALDRLYERGARWLAGDETAVGC